MSVTVLTGDYSMLLEVCFENTMELDRFIGELQYFGRTKSADCVLYICRTPRCGALGRVFGGKTAKKIKKLVFSGLVCYNP